MNNKIAIIIFNLKNGGAERVISILSLHLNKKYELMLLLYDANHIEYKYSGKILDLKKTSPSEKKSKTHKKAVLNRLVDFYIIHCSSTYFEVFTSFFSTLYYTIIVRKIKKKYKFRTTISFLSHPNLVNILSCTNEKKIISVRSNFSKKIIIPGSAENKFKFYIRLLYNRADIIVANSEGVKKDLQENIKIESSKLRVIYNPVDHKSINIFMQKEIEDEYKSYFLNPVIISVGRLSYEKGHHHLIRIIPEIKKEHPNIQILFLGRGGMEHELTRLVQNLKLENNVHFLGFQSNPFKFIKKSTIFVLPSYVEGFPNALIEAMACGIPVIASDCRSGPREILSPASDVSYETETVEYAPYGILVPVCSKIPINSEIIISEKENMLAASINYLLSDQELIKKYSYLAKKRSDDFSIDKIIKQWEDLIK